MKTGQLPHLSKPISRVVLGTMHAKSDNQDQSFALFDHALALGCSCFDTAHVYGRGESERVLGRWLRERGNRQEVVLITKGAHPKSDGVARVTPAAIAADLDESLARLQVEMVDIYLLHRDDESVPVGELVDALNDQQRAGRIGVYGGSNWSHGRLQEANAYAAARGVMPMVASSPNFSLAEQAAAPWPGCQSISGDGGRAARRWYAEEQMALFAWSSLAGGFFSGRFRPDNLAGFTDYFDQVTVATYGTAANFERLARAEALARQKGVSLPQIAIAYVLNYPLNLFAISGSLTPGQLSATVAAAAVELTAAEVSWLEGG